MALIGSIRKNSWVLIVLIAVGMGGFILQSIVQGSSQYASGDRNTMGEINGEKIDYREFSEAERVLYGNSNSNTYSNRSNLWNYFKNKTLTNTLASEIGLGVSTQELLDLQFGERLSPIITTRFKNKQTNMVDRNTLNKIKEMIDAGSLNQDYKKFWAVQEKEIAYTSLNSKMSDLVSKAIYIPSWFAKDNYNLENTKVDFDYVKVPFDKIPDDEVNVTDKDIEEYYNTHKNMYTQKEEKRVIDYAVFSVKPTDSDVDNIHEQAKELASDFRKSENDSLFVVSNEGIISPVYYDFESLPTQIKTDSTLVLNKGLVIGPYKDKDVFTVAKIIDKRPVPDSVSASHILRAVPQGQATPEAFAAARKFIDSLKTVLDKKQQTFDSLAIKYSQDPGSAPKGGDLGTFAQGAMVPAFNDACFLKDKNDYHIVTTRFGVHLINVKKQIYNNKDSKYKVAYISKPIVPSEETQDSIYTLCGEILSTSDNPEALKEGLAKYNVSFKESIPLGANDFVIMELGANQTSRDIVRWAFEEGTEVNDIAPTVYTYTNKVLYYNEKYVLAYLKKIDEPGKFNLETVRKKVETLVKNELKGKKIEEKIGSNDLSEVAKQFNLSVENASQVAFKSKYVDKFGNEPNVMNVVFNGEVGKTYGPIIGSSGVFMVSPKIVDNNNSEPNLIAEKKNMARGVKSSISGGILESISDNVEVKDDRKKFY